MGIYDTGLPPARYDHPYNGMVIERVMAFDELQSFCSRGIKLEKGSFFLGCSYKLGSVCMIFLLDQPAIGSTDIIRRHEIGHCNGWSGNHEH